MNNPTLIFITFISLLQFTLPGRTSAESSMRQNQSAQNRPLLILFAFEEEGQTISGQMTTDSTVRILGRPVRFGTASGLRIMLAESGVGMTNAALTTQNLIARYEPRGVIFTGIAGAIDSTVHIGDLCACANWATHDYVLYGRDGITPRSVRAFVATVDSIASMKYFPVDSNYLADVRQAVMSKLNFKKIGTREPQVLIGGVGVSGNAFIDNAEKRSWLSDNFKAMVTDMESAAVAQVCTVNGVPFVIIRSASDRAGGSGSGSAREEMNQFFQVAAFNSSALVLELIKLLP